MPSEAGQHEAQAPADLKRSLLDTVQQAPATDRSEREEYLRAQGKLIRAAKRAARSELSVSRGEWRKHGWADTDVLSIEGVHDNVRRFHASELSRAQFVELFERPRMPTVITGLIEDWPAQERWTEQALLQRFGDHRFKVGSDDDGYGVRLKLEHFLAYLSDPEHRLDDSPLYIFDGTFADPKGQPGPGA
ncbi:hypothetical protein WJX84_003667 [Apatococcus fuscideae]|uniref:Transposase n=1 Tax=Apatococcus fuscideae TaxID=2026836 RepID=A0AAW1SZ97_9CHLO